MTSLDDAAARPRLPERDHDTPGAPPAPREIPALRLDGAELAVLLSLRHTKAADISRQILGISAEPAPEGRTSLGDRGLWQVRHGMGLPAAQAITVGATLTAAVCWLRIGTSDATAATIIIGPEHTLLLAALGGGAQEIATLQADADVAEIAAGICHHLASQVSPGEQLHVHVLGLTAAGSPSERIIAATDHAEAATDHAEAAANAEPDLTAQVRQAIAATVGR